MPWKFPQKTKHSKFPKHLQFVVNNMEEAFAFPGDNLMIDGEPAVLRPMPPSDVPPSNRQDSAQLDDLMNITANIPKSAAAPPPSRAAITSATANMDFVQSQKSPPKPTPAPFRLADPSKTEIPSPRRHAPSPPRSPDRLPPAEEYQRDHSPDRRQMPEPSRHEFLDQDGGGGQEPDAPVRPPLTRARKTFLMARVEHFRRKRFHDQTFDPVSADWNYVETLVDQCEERMRQENALKNTRDLFTVATNWLQRGILEGLNPRVPDYARIDLDHGPNGEESWHDMIYVATNEEGRFDDVLLEIHQRYLQHAIENPLAKLGMMLSFSMLAFSQQRAEERKLAAAAKQEENEFRNQQQQQQPSSYGGQQQQQQQPTRQAPQAPVYPIVNERQLKDIVERAQENAVPGVQINSDFEQFVKQQQQQSATSSIIPTQVAQPIESSPPPATSTRTKKSGRGGRKPGRSSAANNANNGKDELLI